MENVNKKSLELRVEELENRISVLEHKLIYKECPTCYGNGCIESPSKENIYDCDNCNGSGEIRR